MLTTHQTYHEADR